MSELLGINLSQKNKLGVNLSREIDQVIIDLYALINKITKALGISYVVIGATARDLVLHHGFGAPIRRATTDIDFGMQVESWDDFEKIKAALIDNGFVTTKNAHRLIGPNNTKIDVVPFGKLEDKASNIQWPPKGDFEMSVLGFQEAHDNAIKVILQQEPLVVTLGGCLRMRNLLRKIHFGHILRKFSLNRMTIRLKFAQNLTQNGFPS